MTGLRFLLAFAVLPLLGLATWIFPGVRALALPARIGVAGAAGAVLLSVEMFLLHLMGVQWSAPVIAAPLLIASTVGVWVAVRRRRAPSGRQPDRRTSPFLALTVFALLLATYAAGTARATSVDLLLFWGGKAARFAAEGQIDAAFLSDPRNRFMHPDYPPLFTSLGAWATLAAGRFAWGAALLTMPLFLAATALTFFGFARETVGRERASQLTALLAALLSFACVVSLSAGNAEPPLLLFETLALAGIVFGRGKTRDAAVAVGLAGAVWTKVEGAAFAALCVFLFLWFQRADPARWKRLLRVAAPAAVLLVSWILWAAHHGLLQAYLGATYGGFSAERWKLVLVRLLQTADYGAFYLPWLLLLFLSPLRWRNPDARALVGMAVVYLLFIFFSYLHGSFDQTAWIQWSAERLLMTPLLFLFFASAASARKAEPSESGRLLP
ncbi:MAG: hypothetical protein ABR576_01120 [Thermoanaerobaculia bacterium]